MFPTTNLLQLTQARNQLAKPRKSSFQRTHKDRERMGIRNKQKMPDIAMQVKGRNSLDVLCQVFRVGERGWVDRGQVDKFTSPFSH